MSLTLAAQNDAKGKTLCVAAEQGVARVFAAIIIKCGVGRCKSLCGLILKNRVCKCLQELLRCLAFVTLKATKKKKNFLLRWREIFVRVFEAEISPLHEKFLHFGRVC